MDYEYVTLVGGPHDGKSIRVPVGVSYVEMYPPLEPAKVLSRGATPTNETVEVLRYLRKDFANGYRRCCEFHLEEKQS